MMLNRKQCLCFAWCHRKYMVFVSHKSIHQSSTLHLRKPSSAKNTINSFTNTAKTTDYDILQTQKAVSYGNTNFYGVEGDEGVIYTDEMPKHQQLIQDSIRKLQSNPKGEFKTVSFGAVRLDSENTPTYYGRYSVGVERPELALENKKTEKENLENEVDNLTDNVNYVSNTEQNLSLSNIKKDFQETGVLKPETNSSDLLKSSSKANLSSACTFEGNQADSFETEKSNFINDLYFPDIKISENTVKVAENAFRTKGDSSSKNDFCPTLQNEIQQSKISSVEKSSNYIDEQYFPETMAKDLPAKHSQSGHNYIDDQYFSNIGSVKETTESDKSHFVVNANNSDLNRECNNNITSHIDKPDFSQSYTEKQTTQKLANENLQNKKLNFSYSQLPSDSHKKSEKEIPNNELSVSDSMLTRTEKNTSTKSGTHVNKSLESGSTSASNVETETAYDFVKKLREKQSLSEEVKRGISAKKEKKLDSKGFRVLKHQVPSLIYFTRDEMLELLKKNILYIDEDIVVLNKPYNLVIHESTSTKNLSCLSTYLNDFAQLIGERNQSPELFTVHRLDKETTGCLLLARNEEAAQRMKSLFAQRKITKTYWIVTSKVPDPMEGAIDIPISEGKIGDRARMVLHPDLSPDTPYVNHSKCGKRAVTFYKVIATSGNAALVEVKPETGIKHQIRVHFGFGLACPILGDHKYSYLDKFVPQKLSSDLLQKLNVRQSKVRHIPLHIHSKHILIPQYADQKNLYVTAPLPHHMSENLRFLKFKKKDKFI